MENKRSIGVAVFGYLLVLNTILRVDLFAPMMAFLTYYLKTVKGIGHLIGLLLILHIPITSIVIFTTARGILRLDRRARINLLFLSCLMIGINIISIIATLRGNKNILLGDFQHSGHISHLFYSFISWFYSLMLYGLILWFFTRSKVKEQFK